MVRHKMCQNWPILHILENFGPKSKFHSKVFGTPLSIACVKNSLRMLKNLSCYFFKYFANLSKCSFLDMAIVVIFDHINHFLS